MKIYGTRRKDYPPGPYGLPIVGYLPFLTEMPHEKLMRLGKKYGDVISLRLGSQAVVVLNSGDVIREAYAKQEFLGRPDQSRSFVVPIKKKWLPDSVQILYGAGSETARTTISWCLYTMAAFPQVQEKVQEETDEVVGRERSPSFADHKHMRYTQSVLMEIQRWKTVVPLSVLRMTLADTDVAGYHIPKDTFIMANLWAVHHDPRCWKNPEDFVPDRFLSEDAQSVVKNENYMPFSVGKRSCLGEKIAVIEVFLYFTNILQKFRVQLPEGQEPSFRGYFSITYQPKLHELRFMLRED